MLLQNKRILVTGGTGSLGKILVHRLLSGKMGCPKKIIVLSRDEAKQHHMRLAYLHKTFTTDDVIYQNFDRVLEFRIGDVRNYSDLCCALRDVDIVINAAALKQVPICEYFPEQAIMTNCQGAVNIVHAISEHNYPIETVVGLSTDKACKPINAMGMTKALQERIFISANILNPKTRFICVRYGNVMASRGSVIPMFHDQILRGGPVTITTENMTRFLLSINQAVDTIFAAIQFANAGETFVPDVPSATIVNVAKALIGEKEIEIKAIGIRPGEKFHEIMVSDEECFYTVKRENYYAIGPMLPELRKAPLPDELPLSKEFSSADRILSYEQTVELLDQHHLLDIGCYKNEDEILV